MLRVNAGRLGDDIAVYPKRGSTAALRKAAIALWGSDAAEDEAKLADAAAAIARHADARGVNTALVSDENILAKHVYEGERTIFRFAAQVLPIIARAVAPCHSRFVFYTRPMESWLKSAHNQAVKNTRLSVEFDEWRASIPFEPDWDVQLAALREATGLDISFIEMARDMDAGRILGASLLDACGIASSVQRSLTMPVPRNESMSDGALEFLLKANQSPLKWPALREVRRLVLENPDLFAAA